MNQNGSHIVDLRLNECKKNGYNINLNTNLLSHPGGFHNLVWG